MDGVAQVERDQFYLDLELSSDSESDEDIT
jgi:hypothetical protein